MGSLINCVLENYKKQKKSIHISIYILLWRIIQKKTNGNYRKSLTDFIFLMDKKEFPPKAAIPKLNSYLVDTSDLIICYVSYISNGAYSVLRYAQKKSKRKPFIINLGDIK